MWLRAGHSFWVFGRSRNATPGSLSQMWVCAGHSSWVWSRSSNAIHWSQAQHCGCGLGTNFWYGVEMSLAQNCWCLLGTASGNSAGMLLLAQWQSIGGVCWAQILATVQKCYLWVNGTALWVCAGHIFLVWSRHATPGSLAQHCRCGLGMVQECH